MFVKLTKLPVPLIYARESDHSSVLVESLPLALDRTWSQFLIAFFYLRAPLHNAGLGLSAT